MKNLSDGQLVSLATKNNQEALETLISRYLKPIYNFVRRYINNQSDAEDVTQEIFLKSWKHLKRFRLDKSFKVWLFAIAKNAAFDFLRKKRIITFTELAEEDKKGEILEEPVADAALLPSQLLEQKELAQKINQALLKLPVKQRAVIWLHYQEDMTFQEIAEVLHEPLNTTKSRYHRGLLTLRRFFVAPKPPFSAY